MLLDLVHIIRLPPGTIRVVATFISGSMVNKKKSLLKSTPLESVNACLTMPPPTQFLSFLSYLNSLLSNEDLLNFPAPFSSVSKSGAAAYLFKGKGLDKKKEWQKWSGCNQWSLYFKSGSSLSTLLNTPLHPANATKAILVP